jgi:hypothetical protein
LAFAFVSAVIYHAVSRTHVLLQLAGWVDTANGRFLVQSFVFVKPPIGPKLEKKGPKLEGTLNKHVGPVPIGLPKVGTIDIWVKVENNALSVTIKIVFFGKTYTKQFTIGL